MLEHKSVGIRNGILICIKNVVEVANIQTHATVHTLRHSYATHIIQSGVDIRIVKEMRLPIKSELEDLEM